MSKKHLYLVDTKLIAYFLVQRGGSIADIFNKIADILWKHPKGLVYLAFDVGKSRYRTSIYSEYKGHRAKLKAKQSEEDKEKSIVFEKDYLACIDIAKALPVKVLAVKGVEADDLISITTEKALASGYQVHLITADMDYVNSVVGNDNVDIINVFTGEVIDHEYVSLKYGDLLKSRDRFNVHKSLFGDRSDNIKFLRGFGEVKANEFFTQLYTKYDNPTIDEIVTELLEYLKQYPKIRVHDFHIKDGRHTVKEAFLTNMQLADTFRDTSKLNEVELAQYTSEVNRELPSGISEEELIELSMNLISKPIILSDKARKIFKVT